MTYINRFLVKNELTKDEFQMFQVFLKIFPNIPPSLIQHAIKNEKELETGLHDYLDYWERYFSKYGKLNLLNLGLFPIDNEELSQFLNEKIEAWKKLRSKP